MKKFNLSKYYTLNWLAYISWLINIMYLFFASYMFYIYPHKCEGSLCSLDPFIYTLIYYLVGFLIMFLLLLSALVELILRKLNKIKNFNILIMPKNLYTFLYWVGIILIPISFTYCVIIAKLISNLFVGD